MCINCVCINCVCIKDAPPYDPAIGLDRAQEMLMHSHYGRPGYWIDEIPVKAQALETMR